jgi:hypothetical protein
VTYVPPLRDLAFSLDHLAEAGRLKELLAGYDDDTQSAVLDAAGRFARDVLAPLNRIGDETGARYLNGTVQAAPGFAQAYRTFAEAGWNGLAAPVDFGGQGLPRALSLAVFEMLHSANMAFGLCPMLTQAAIEVLCAYGSDRQRSLYLGKLVSGAWTGTMNLTEPQAGSDLASVRLRAEPDGDGRYRLSGQKIFITWGDHDMSENIVHLVLARVAGAPEGTKGLSLFLVPKRRVNDDGSLSAANAVSAMRIEEKLGIHGSPTCTMLYDGADAELVGAPNQGLALMFTMMNAARLQVGVEGVAIAERAYQQALAFARERRQGRSVWTGEYPAPIVDHPDVRRMLALMKARIEAARGLCLATGVAADLARAGDERARLREELFTPIAKAWSTDMGVEVASLGVQMHGGMGYIEETGAAQHYRDARITPIYEGTNGIQAIDLVGRKLALADGAALSDLFADIRATIAAIDTLPGVAARLSDAVVAAETATAWLRETQRANPASPLAGATPCLTLLGDTIGGWMLAKGALAAARSRDSSSPTRAALARFYAGHVLARTPGIAAAAMAGDDDLRSLTPDVLTTA